MTAPPLSDQLFQSWMSVAPRDRGLDFVILRVGTPAGKDDVVVNEVLVRTCADCGAHLLLAVP